MISCVKFCRLVAKRSTPKVLICDNASTFISADKTLKEIYYPGVREYHGNSNINWKFIFKRAPWTGGIYERVIGLTKQALRKVLGSYLVSINELRTSIVEIAARPGPNSF